MLIWYSFNLYRWGNGSYTHTRQPPAVTPADYWAVRQMGGWCWWEQRWMYGSPTTTRGGGAGRVWIGVCFCVMGTGNCHKGLNSCFNLVYVLKYKFTLSTWASVFWGPSRSWDSTLGPGVETKKTGKCVGRREELGWFQSTAELQPLL